MGVGDVDPYRIMYWMLSLQAIDTNHDWRVWTGHWTVIYHCAVLVDRRNTSGANRINRLTKSDNILVT